MVSSVNRELVIAGRAEMKHQQGLGKDNQQAEIATQRRAETTNDIAC